mmetsp:Transcript_6643/g.11217  ORF Transcript_6643/g.11217 Transcript_6643/m.11217 type:complete len:233 (-) Transcript_6643:100-798(-)
MPSNSVSEDHYWQSRWRDEADRALEFQRRVSALEIELEQAQQERDQLKAESLQRAQARQRELRRTVADKAALKDAQSDLASLRNECDLLRSQRDEAAAERDEAKRKMRALSEELEDAPGHANGATVLLLRKQLAEALKRKAAYKDAARQLVLRLQSVKQTQTWDQKGLSAVVGLTSSTSSSKGVTSEEQLCGPPIATSNTFAELTTPGALVGITTPCKSVAATSANDFFTIR